MIQSAAEFVRLRSSEDPAEYHRAAHEEADVSVWLDVIDKYPDMRFWVAHNKTVPLEILELLASDPDVRVRSFVATKRKINIDLLQKLALDEDDTVRAAVTRHRRATTELIESLLDDESWFVRDAANEALAKRTISRGLA
ncbi:HEAT repeat domain-containing protein [Micrococcaceae bacterium Sec5.1]